MGITINGAGNANAQPVMTGTLTIKNTNDPNSRMAAVRKKEQTVKKPLNYNHREISGQLLRAKKPQSAATTLTRAKSKLAVLQRAAGSGQYDEKEVANAIAHARRMVRCAQMKVRNLREEEREQKANRNESGAKEQKLRNEVKRRVAAKERELEQKTAREEMQAVIQEKQRRTEMAQKRRTHRNQERGKVAEADMKYIKDMMRDGKMPGGTSVSTDGAVIMDLSGSAAAMNEIAMMEQQIQAEAEAEVAAEIAMEMGADMGGAALQGAGSGMTGGGTTSAAGTAGAADAGVASVDVSI